LSPKAIAGLVGVRACSAGGSYSVSGLCVRVYVLS
jgi:hypothetical protein